MSRRLPAELRSYPTTQPTEPTRLVKTVRVEDLVDYANRVLTESTGDYEKERAGVFMFIEKVLLDANAYAGFQFTDGANGGVDPTRRRYYVKAELRSEA